MLSRTHSLTHTQSHTHTHTHTQHTTHRQLQMFAGERTRSFAYLSQGQFTWIPAAPSTLPIQTRYMYMYIYIHIYIYIYILNSFHSIKLPGTRLVCDLEMLVTIKKRFWLNVHEQLPEKASSRNAVILLKLVFMGFSVAPPFSLHPSLMIPSLFGTPVCISLATC